MAIETLSLFTHEDVVYHFCNGYSPYANDESSLLRKYLEITDKERKLLDDLFELCGVDIFFNKEDKLLETATKVCLLILKRNKEFKNSSNEIYYPFLVRFVNKLKDLQPYYLSFIDE